jgi:hypothetical protein
MALFRQPLLQREVTIIRNMKRKLKLPVARIAIAVGRTKKAVYKALDPTWKLIKRGRQDALTPGDLTFLLRKLKALIKKAASKTEVTLGMLKKSARCKVSLKCMRKHVMKMGVRFRRLRSKCLLSKEDIKKRYAFASIYRHKSRAWWLKKVQLHHGMKSFPVYSHAAARDHAARREVRGAYRNLGQGLDDCYVVQPKPVRYNSGARPCCIATGVGNGRVLMWHEITGTWNAGKAIELYGGPLKQALSTAYPRKRSHIILEDNDPNGFKAKLAMKAINFKENFKNM